MIYLQNVATNSTDIKLSWQQKFGWATGDFAQNLIYTTISTYLLFFYTNVYGLPAVDAATMFLIVRLIDAINDPIVGTFIDKHTTRFGKYRGYLLYMGLPLAVMAILCFYVPDFSQLGKLIYAYVTYVGLSIIYTTVNIPYGSLNAAMTRNNKELVSMSSIRMFLANLGSLAVSFGVPVCVKLFSGGYYSGDASKTGWFLTMIVYGVVGALVLVFCFSQSTEHIKMSADTEATVSVGDLFHQLKINGPLRVLAIFFIITFGLMSVVNSVGAYYMTYNAHNAGLMQWYNLLGTLPAFITVPITPWLNRKLGTQVLMQGSLIIIIIGFLIMFLVPATDIFWTFTGRTIEAAGVTLSTGFQWALVPQVITYGEWKTGKRENGIINAIVGFFFKFGMALGGVIPGYVLAAYGFVANHQQTVRSLFGIRMTTTIIPIIVTIFAMVVFAFYKLTDEKIEKMNNEIQRRNLNNI
ncbi:MFS transporter [Limosilactobacillus reuteri]|uniref:MFS transporter n=1 Tax=Limosilactobacillus reuteri TaxID=1598 RepID=UPI001E507448|nr:MFS transporter [Limosilactobacillus reuteri]MCC4435263.1 MFS transporter [Limosilactobacillus reuteri]MCC4437539.1 MFS transporter [Limosilactobacillus reuteri]MCC4441326.1 MFS transporter [Limosilactobacillus reuteri]MCC4443317.1 MFS transporter [Limosilactobacillus reuteri]MCC4445287.1 MFS transporter [Limosilactobacillus reuteri]